MRARRAQQLPAVDWLSANASGFDEADHYAQTSTSPPIVVHAPTRSSRTLSGRKKEQPPSRDAQNGQGLLVFDLEASCGISDGHHDSRGILLPLYERHDRRLGRRRRLGLRRKG